MAAKVGLKQTELSNNHTYEEKDLYKQFQNLQTGDEQLIKHIENR